SGLPPQVPAVSPRAAPDSTFDGHGRLDAGSRQVQLVSRGRAIRLRCDFRAAREAGVGGVSAIRPFVAGDIPQVARLHQKVWGGNADRSGAYSRYFTGVFLENPAGDGLLSSLVCEDNDRRIVGFLGI